MSSNSKNRILFVTSAYPRKLGEQRDMFIFDLANQLSNSVDVFVLAPLDKNSSKIETYNKVKVFRHLQFPFNLARIAYGSGILPNIKKNIFLSFCVPFYFAYQFFYIKKIVKQYNITIIHAHWLIPNAFITSVYKKWFNKKVKIVLTIHGNDLFSFNNKLGMFIKNFTLKYINRVSVVSNTLKHFLLKNTKWNDEVYVYPMGINTSIFKPINSIFIKKNSSNLLFVGRIIKEKGIDIIIDAMPTIVAKFPKIILTIIGEGNLKPQLQNRIKELDINENVIFLGQKEHSELPSYFSSTDLFLFPSLSEGFGLVLAEAMACECLVLSNNIEAIKDIVDNKVNGYILQELNAQSLAKQTINILMLSNQEKEDIKKKARKKIVENFDINITINNYLNLYKVL